MRTIKEKIAVIATAECARDQLHAARPTRRRESGAQRFVAHRSDASIAECVECCGCNRSVCSLVSTEQADAHRAATFKFYLNAVASE
jgi:hypothetical protein